MLEWHALTKWAYLPNCDTIRPTAVRTWRRYHYICMTQEKHAQSLNASLYINGVSAWHCKLYVYMAYRPLQKCIIKHTYTSDFSENSLSCIDSGAIHRRGSLVLRVDTYRSVSLDSPKSAIFSTFPIPTSTFRQARSRWITLRAARCSCMDVIYVQVLLWTHYTNNHNNNKVNN